jgi:hypothetical protein
MKQKTHFRHPIIQGCLLLALALTTPTASAVIVDMLVTPLGGSYRYEVSVNNDEVVDLAIVSIIDAPLGDPLIDPTLTTPAGFLGSYDDGLGFVDFLADTDGFLAGTTVGGFRFESLSAPGTFFTTFTALSVAGDEFTGPINVRTNAAVPDTGGTWSLAGLAFLALAFAYRHLPTRGGSQPHTLT